MGRGDREGRGGGGLRGMRGNEKGLLIFDSSSQRDI